MSAVPRPLTGAAAAVDTPAIPTPMANRLDKIIARIDISFQLFVDNRANRKWLTGTEDGSIALSDEGPTRGGTGLGR